MVHIYKMDEFLNESFGSNYIRKSIQFIEKIKDLFEHIKISDDELRDIINSNSIYSAVLLSRNYYNQVKEIVDNNRDRIKYEYDLVFGTKEEFFCSLILSVAVMLAFYYAVRKGWIDKLLGKVDKNYGGGYGDYKGSNNKWWQKSKSSSKIKQRISPELPKINKTGKEIDVDRILDKMASVGYNGLTEEEKMILKKQ